MKKNLREKEVNLMQIPLEISFRDVQKTKALELLIQKKVSKLETICSYITSCRIAIEKTNQHQRSGNPFRVRMSISVPPNHELVVRRESSEGNLHDDLRSVIGNVFDAARHQLHKLDEKHRHEVKTHPHKKINGIINKLFRNEGYGFIQSLDGSEIYFHRHSVLHGNFDRLKIGTGVYFHKEEGEEGPQASTLQIIDKPGSHISISPPPADQNSK